LPTIRAHWLDLYVNREKEIGLSVLQAVAPKDEWCAEAYMETDYSTITQNNFEEIVKNYAMFRLLGAGSMANLMVDHDDG
jgi:type I restriction enzyme M protein